MYQTPNRHPGNDLLARLLDWLGLALAVILLAVIVRSIPPQTHAETGPDSTVTRGW